MLPPLPSQCPAFLPTKESLQGSHAYVRAPTLDSLQSLQLNQPTTRTYLHTRVDNGSRLSHFTLFSIFPPFLETFRKEKETRGRISSREGIGSNPFPLSAALYRSVNRRSADYTPFIAARRSITAFNLLASLRGRVRGLYRGGDMLMQRDSWPISRASISPSAYRRDRSQWDRSLPRFGRPYRLVSFQTGRFSSWKLSYRPISSLLHPCFQIGNLSSDNFSPFFETIMSITRSFFFSFESPRLGIKFCSIGILTIF